MDIFPRDTQTIEATYRLASTADGRKHVEHLKAMLQELDEQSRTTLGDIDLINKGKRQCLVSLIVMFETVSVVMKERRPNP